MSAYVLQPLPWHVSTVPPLAEQGLKKIWRLEVGESEESEEILPPMVGKELEEILRMVGKELEEILPMVGEELEESFARVSSVLAVDLSTCLPDNKRGILV